MVPGFKKSWLCLKYDEVSMVTKISKIYSKIPILRPPLGVAKSGLKDHFLDSPKGDL